MNSFIAPTTPPRSRPELISTQDLWRGLLVALRERGYQGRRESGAFLLGHRTDNQSRMSEYMLYDDLDPHSLDRGIVHFDGRHYGALWEHCRRTGHLVIADVHTHPCGSEQSPSDRAHPMVAMNGHIALILPRFGTDDAPREEIGMYRYLGARRWHTVPRQERSDFLHIENSRESA